MTKKEIEALPTVCYPTTIYRWILISPTWKKQEYWYSNLWIIWLDSNHEPIEKIWKNTDSIQRYTPQPERNKLPTIKSDRLYKWQIKFWSDEFNFKVWYGLSIIDIKLIPKHHDEYTL